MSRTPNEKETAHGRHPNHCLIFVVWITALTALQAVAQVSANLDYAIAIGGSGTDTGENIVVDSSRNVYTTGQFQTTVDFDPGPSVISRTSVGLSDVFVQKLSPTGELLYVATFGGAGSDFARGIAVDAMGNVYTTGIFRETVDFDPSSDMFLLTSRGNNDVFVQKLDSLGNLVYAVAMGGPDFEFPEGISVGASGNVYVAGGFRGTADFDPSSDRLELTSSGEQDVFILKLDPFGNLGYARALQGTGFDQASDIAADSTGNVYVTGCIEGTTDFDPGPDVFELSSFALEDVFVLKLDPDGILDFAVVMGGGGSDRGNDIAIDDAGNSYTTGHFEGTVDFDPSAQTFQLTSGIFQDVFVTKLDSAGAFDFALAFGGLDFDVGRGIAVDVEGNMYVTGAFRGTADFDPGPGVFELSSGLEIDPFVQKLSPDGRLVYAISMGSGGFDTGSDIAVDLEGDVLTVGTFEGSMDFDPGPDTFVLSSAGQGDAFIQKLVPTESISVPNLVGLLRATAEATLRAVGLTVGTIYSEYNSTFSQGLVIEHDPAAGAFTDPGALVDLLVSLGPELVEVPDLVGLSLQDAEIALGNVGLTTGTTSEEFSVSVPEGEVIRQSPVSGTAIPVESEVDIVLSSGVAELEMIRQVLLEDFELFDDDGSGGLSLLEARMAIPDLLAIAFDALDTDGNGFLTRTELGAEEEPPLIIISPGRGDFGYVEVGRSRDIQFRLDVFGGQTRRIDVTVNSQSPYVLTGESSFSIAPGGSRILEVRFTPPAENAYPASVRFEGLQDEPVDIEIIGRGFTALGTISGIVFDASGQPQACASIIVRGANEFFRVVPVDIDGTYLLPEVPPGTYEVMVVALASEQESVQATVVGDLITVVDVRTEVPLIDTSLSGTVLDDSTGEPLGGVLIEALDSSGLQRSSTRTCANGGYDLRIPETKVPTRVAFSAPGYVIDERTIDPNETNSQNIFLSLIDPNSAGGVSGRITDGAEGVSDARVNALSGELSRRVVSSVNGDYEISGIPSGQYEIQVTADGYMPTTAFVTVLGSGAVTARNFQLNEGAEEDDEGRNDEGTSDVPRCSGVSRSVQSGGIENFLLYFATVMSLALFRRRTKATFPSLLSCTT